MFIMDICCPKKLSIDKIYENCEKQIHDPHLEIWFVMPT